jgi:hypothetical protein
VLRVINSTLLCSDEARASELGSRARSTRSATLEELGGADNGGQAGVLAAQLMARKIHHNPDTTKTQHEARARG